MNYAALCLATLLLTACSGTRAWQPVGGEPARTMSASAESSSIDAWAQRLLRGTAADWTASTQARDGTTRRELKAGTLSSSQAATLMREYAANWGLNSIKVFRSARFTPASWDLELVSETGNDGAARAPALDAVNAALAALGGSPVQGRGWLDAMSFDGRDLAVDLRLPAYTGDSALHDEGHHALQLALVSKRGRYTVREIEIEKKVRWRVVSYRVEAVTATKEIPASEPLRWQPDGGPTAAPARDSNDSMKRPDPNRKP